jgi:Leucine-rich repeat (LRR) protein
MCLTLLPATVFAATFTDVPDWASEAVEYLSSNGIMNGTSENTFGLDGELQRKQMAAILCRIEGVNLPDEAPASPPIIEDVTGDDETYMGGFIDYVVDKGWMTLDGARFRPNDNITRQEFVFALASVLELPTGEANTAVLGSFTDSNAVDAAYQEAMAYFVERGYIRGTSADTLSPAAFVNRITTAMLLYNVLKDNWTPDNPETPVGFADVESWASEAVLYLASNGIMNGYADGTFGFNDTIDRAQMAIVLCRANNVSSPSETPASAISDVSGHWAADFINHVVAEGWMAVDSSGNFNPAGLVAREEFMLALVSLLPGYEPMSDAQADIALSAFTDSSEIGVAYKSAVAYLASTGIISGTQSGSFSPRGNMIRGEMALLMHSVMTLTSADTPIAIPDANFRAYVQSLVGANTPITKDAVSAIRRIDVRNESISDLTGIEHFTALEELDCGENNITALDLSKNTEMIRLVCDQNPLATLKVTGLAKLNEISAVSCAFSSLDVSGLTSLKILTCGENENLTSVNVNGCTALEGIVITYTGNGEMKLASLDVSGLSSLKHLDLWDCGLTSLTLTGCTSLEWLRVGGNSGIASLDVTDCTALLWLDIQQSGLTAENITGLSNSTTVMSVYIDPVLTATAGNGDVTLSWTDSVPAANKYIIEYRAFDGAVSNVEWEDNNSDLPPKTVISENVTNPYTVTGLTNETTYTFVVKSSYNIGGGQTTEYIQDPSAMAQAMPTALVTITDANFREYVQGLVGQGNPITKDAVKDIAVLTMNGKGISDLTGIEHFTALTHLACSDNNIASLDLTKNKNLVWLQATFNNMTTLNVSGLTNLEYVQVCDNALTSVNVSGCTALTSLDVGVNNLTALNLADCAALVDLSCVENSLTSLDVSNKTALKQIWAYDNPNLAALNVAGCSALKQIHVMNTDLASLTVTGLTSLRFINASGSKIADLSSITGLTGQTTAILTLQFSSWTAAAGNGSVTLSWPNAVPAGSYYRVEYVEYDASLNLDEWGRDELGFPEVTVVENIQPGNQTTSHTITGLTNGKSYCFALYVLYDLGGGDVAQYSNSNFILRATPSAPSNPNPDPGDSGNGGGGGGGGTPSTPSTPGQTEVDVPSSAGSAVEITATVDSDTGKVSMTLDTKTQDALIADAVAKASGQDAQPTVTLDLSEVKEAKSAVIDVNAAQAFSEAEVAVTLKLPDAEITLSPEALAGLAATTSIGTTPVTVEASNVPTTSLEGMQAAQSKEYETVVSIDVFVGDTKVDASISVSLPYTLKPGENPAAVSVWYMDDNGNLTNLNGTYSSTTGQIAFTVNHQSYFVVGYDPVALWENVFSDVAEGVWYYDAVAYANYYRLFEGYGNGIFAPQDSMTRAMFATVLWNQEGKPAPQGAKSFGDVPEGVWYHDAIIWAAECEIVAGYAGNFDPNRAITRQEMSVMMHRYAGYKSYSLPDNRKLPTFTDYSQIASWAETAANELAEAGVLSGDNNQFMPNDVATRAQVAQMFKNFLRFVIG